MLEEYLHHRVSRGRRHRHGGWPGGYGYGRMPQRYGYGMSRRHSGGLFAPRRHSRVQVRGCGCCLPIPLGVLTVTALGARTAMRRSGR